MSPFKKGRLSKHAESPLVSLHAHVHEGQVSPIHATVYLDSLPLDMLLEVLAHLTDPYDCAALSLASPRLGILAHDKIPCFQGVLVAVAMALWRKPAKEVLTEFFCVQYAQDPNSTRNGCAWLQAQAASKRQAPENHSPFSIVPVKINVNFPMFTAYAWRLCQMTYDKKGRASRHPLRGRILRKERVYAPSGTTDYIAFFDGAKKQERLLKVVMYKDAQNPKQVTHTIWFEGTQPGQEHKVVEETACTKDIFEGERHCERLISRMCIKTGKHYFFEGDSSRDDPVRRLVCVIVDKDKEHFFEGKRGHERMVSAVYHGKCTKFFEGCRGLERHVRTCFRSGETVELEGEPGKERIVSRRWLNGDMIFYEGSKRLERKVQMTRLNGEQIHFQGPCGQERKVCVIRRDGLMQFYKGEQNFEQKVQVADQNSYQAFLYEGNKDEERCTQSVSYDGLVKKRRLYIELENEGMETFLESPTDLEASCASYLCQLHSGADYNVK